MPNRGSETSEAERFTIKKWKGGDYFAVYDGEELVCVTVYRRGAREVIRRLEG